MKKQPNMKKLPIALVILTLLVLLTNPTTTDFKDFTGVNYYGEVQKDNNFLLFSMYTKKAVTSYPPEPAERYLGVCKNFFKISPK